MDNITFRQFSQDSLLAIRAHGPGRWILFVCILGLSFASSTALEDTSFALHTRYSVFQWLVGRNPADVPTHDLLLVEISDKDIYQNRGSIELTAEAIRAASAMNARVISVDLNLSQQAAGKTNTPQSIQALRDAIRDSAQSCPIVLPVTLGDDGFQPSILGRLTGDLPDGVSVGFINLAADARAVPEYWLDPEAGRMLPSFSVATALAFTRFRPEGRSWKFLAPPKREELTNKAPMTGFLHPGSFDHISLGDLLAGRESRAVRDLVRGRIVVIGGAFHEEGLGGGQSDIHLTPVGEQLGMMVHANYMVMLLDGRLYPQPAWKPLIEIGLMVPLGLIFAVTGRDRHRLATLAIAIAFYFLSAYVFLINFALAIDPVLPVAFCVLEALTDHFMSKGRATGIAYAPAKENTTG